MNEGKKKGRDRIYAGGGHDRISGKAGKDRLYGSRGNEGYIFAGSGNDLINGAQGSDSIHGEQGRDRIYGGDDIVAGWRDGAKDHIYCGPGVDRVSAGRQHKLFKCERRY